jgi:hypothetical protein
MEMQNYLLLARLNTGAIQEKVNVHCTFQEAKQILLYIMDANSKITLGQILEGNRIWIGDFQVKPLMEIKGNVSDE